MSPRLQNYGTDDDLYLIIEDVRPGISLEVTEDDDQFWVSIKSPDGKLLGDAAINPRSKRDTTYDKHRYSTADYPEPRDAGGAALRLDLGVDPPADLSPSIRLGQYLTRVDSVTADDLARGEPPRQFPTVDETQSFAAMYVLELPSEPDETDAPSVGEGEHTVRTNHGSHPDVTEDGADAPEDTPESAAAPPDAQRTKNVTLFDLETEREFDVPVGKLTAHYGVTVWNTGRFWHE
jgi:hypothetical protein